MEEHTVATAVKFIEDQVCFGAFPFVNYLDFTWQDDMTLRFMVFFPLIIIIIEPQREYDGVDKSSDISC